MTLRKWGTAVLLAGAVASAADLSKKDIEKFDPVHLLLDNQKTLKLDDAQRQALEKLDEPIKWNIKKLTTRIDSAQKDANPGHSGGGIGGSSRGGGSRGGGGGGPDTPSRSPAESRAHMLAARTVVSDAVGELQKEMETGSADALKLMTEAQRPKAEEILKKRADELTQLLRDAGIALPTPPGGSRGAGGFANRDDH